MLESLFSAINIVSLAKPNRSIILDKSLQTYVPSVKGIPDDTEGEIEYFEVS